MRAKQALLAFLKQYKKEDMFYDVCRICYFSNMFSVVDFIYTFGYDQYYSRVIWNYTGTDYISY